MNMKKRSTTAAAEWMVAFGVVALYAGAAHAQISGEIPGGEYLVAIGDAIFNFIRRFIGPIVVGLVFLAALIGGTAGSVQQGIGKAVMTLLIGAFIAAGVIWWPWVKGWFA